MKISIFTTCSNPIERQDLYFEALESYRPLADELVVVDGSNNPDVLHSFSRERLWDKIVYNQWPDEFKWDFIGQQFQRGYEACTGDWVIRVDLDFIFHLNDVQNIRNMLDKNQQEAAMSFWKYQFVIVDRYNLKSRLVLAMNKGLCGDRIKLNAGGDLCQASLDGAELTVDKVKEIYAPVYNYDFMLKTQDVVKRDQGRFARAWHRQFGNYHLGGPDDDSAFQKFLTMQIGRAHKPSGKIKLKQHPRCMQDRISKLKPEQFGHSLWGHYDTAQYFLADKRPSPP